MTLNRVQHSRTNNVEVSGRRKHWLILCTNEATRRYPHQRTTRRYLQEIRTQVRHDKYLYSNLRVECGNYLNTTTSSPKCKTYLPNLIGFKMLVELVKLP